MDSSTDSIGFKFFVVAMLLGLWAIAVLGSRKLAEVAEQIDRIEQGSIRETKEAQASDTGH